MVIPLSPTYEFCVCHCCTPVERERLSTNSFPFGRAEVTVIIIITLICYNIHYVLYNQYMPSILRLGQTRRLRGLSIKNRAHLPHDIANTVPVALRSFCRPVMPPRARHQTMFCGHRMPPPAPRSEHKTSLRDTSFKHRIRTLFSPIPLRVDYSLHVSFLSQYRKSVFQPPSLPTTFALLRYRFIFALDYGESSCQRLDSHRRQIPCFSPI